MNDPRRSCRLFSQTQKAVRSPPRELGMTPAAESLAGSPGGQARFIKQLTLFTDNFPKSTSVNSLHSCSDRTPQPRRAPWGRGDRQETNEDVAQLGTVLTLPGRAGLSPPLPFHWGRVFHTEVKRQNAKLSGSFSSKHGVPRSHLAGTALDQAHAWQHQHEGTSTPAGSLCLTPGTCKGRPEPSGGLLPPPSTRTEAGTKLKEIQCTDPSPPVLGPEVTLSVAARAAQGHRDFLLVGGIRRATGSDHSVLITKLRTLGSLQACQAEGSGTRPHLQHAQRDGWQAATSSLGEVTTEDSSLSHRLAGTQRQQLR